MLIQHNNCKANVKKVSMERKLSNIFEIEPKTTKIEPQTKKVILLGYLKVPLIRFKDPNVCP